MAAALQVLDIDVQLIILDLLSQTSPRSLLNVALSSRSLYRLSKSFIYRVIHFTFNRRRRSINGRLIKQLLNHDDCSSKVREVRILWAPSATLQHGEGSKEDLELLGQALLRLTELKIFIWDAQYPIMAWLLEAVQAHHPHCLLYIRHPLSYDSARTLPRLYASPCLFSFDVTLASEQLQALQAVQHVITSAPKLRDLRISSTVVGRDLGLNQLHRSPNLLHLRSLDLNGSGLFLSEFPVAWSVLERLSVDMFLPSETMPSFSCLKSLTLRRAAGDIAHLGIILQGCKKLEVLDLTGCTKSTQTAQESFWERVGKNLTALRLREEVDSSASLQDMDMGLIVKYCRKLRSFGLDLFCNGREWPYETLRSIADNLWFIAHLELKILIESPQYDHPASPKATLGSVPEIWRYLWQEITNSRVHRGHSITKPRLKSLDLIAGTNYTHGGEASQRFTFDLSERDDKARRGIAPVKCTQLEALRSKMSTGSHLWTHQQELIMRITTERATKGPHIEMPSVTDVEMVRPSPFWDTRDRDRFFSNW